MSFQIIYLIKSPKNIKHAEYISKKKKKKKERKKERKRKQNSNDFVVSWINNKDLWEFQKYCL